MVRRGAGANPRPAPNTLLSTRGRLALLLADMPGRWQDQFLRPGPWPEEFVNAHAREPTSAPARTSSSPR